MQGKTDPDAGRGGARLSSQYMFFGIFAGLLAPGAVMLHALIAERTAEPYRLFAMLAVGGATVFAVLGRIEEEAGIRRHIEGRFLELIEILIHRRSRVRALSKIWKN